MYSTVCFCSIFLSRLCPIVGDSLPYRLRLMPTLSFSEVLQSSENSFADEPAKKSQTADKHKNKFAMETWRASK